MVWHPCEPLATHCWPLQGLLPGSLVDDGLRLERVDSGQAISEERRASSGQTGDTANAYLEEKICTR